MSSQPKLQDFPEGDEHKQIIDHFISYLSGKELEIEKQIASMKKRVRIENTLADMIMYYQILGMDFFQNAVQLDSMYFCVIRSNAKWINLMKAISRMAYKIADDIDACNDNNIPDLQWMRAILEIKVKIANLRSQVMDNR